MIDLFTDITNWLTQHPGWLGVTLLLAAFAESFFVVGVILPGAILLFSLAALAGGLGLPILPLLLWTAVGASIGDISSFFIGRELEHLFHDRTVRRSWHRHLDRTHAFLEKWGVLAVVVGRFVGAVRPFLPAVAGAAGMRRRVFILSDLLSSLAWAPFYILPGYYSASAFT
ncbi:MAG TPA: DedA family protein [Gammaproteobacteria bacterium]